MNKISSYTDNKINWWILFYVVLGVVQALWTNMSSFPPLPFRLLMIFAVFAPILFNRELVLFAIPFFMILRGQLATDYQYLPDIRTYIFYIGMLAVVFCIHGKAIKLKNFRCFAPLALFCMYLFIIDILSVQKIGPYVTHIFFGLLLTFFIVKKNDVHILAAALIAACTLLAVYYILMYDLFLETWNSVEGLERSGWNDPNYFSILLGMGYMISMLYLLNYLQSDLIIFKKSILIVACLVIFAAVVMTASRAGFLAVSAMSLFSLVKSKPKLKVVLFAFLIIVVFVGVLYKWGVFDTLIYRFLVQDNISTGGSRTIIWKRVCENYYSQPYLSQVFGGGYWHRAFLSHGHETHNEFLAILSDYGLIGLCMYIVILFSMVIGRGRYTKARAMATIYYILSVISLSPFQYVYIVFFLIWIIGLKRVDDANHYYLSATV